MYPIFALLLNSLSERKRRTNVTKKGDERDKKVRINAIFNFKIITVSYKASLRNTILFNSYYLFLNAKLDLRRGLFI